MMMMMSRVAYLYRYIGPNSNVRAVYRDESNSTVQIRPIG